VTLEEIASFYYSESAEKVDRFLAHLDAESGASLQKELGNEYLIRHFHALYRYLGKYEHVNILKITTALERLLKQFSPIEVELFACPSTSFFNTSLNVYQLVLVRKISKVIVTKADESSLEALPPKEPSRFVDWYAWSCIFPSRLHSYFLRCGYKRNVARSAKRLLHSKESFLLALDGIPSSRLIHPSLLDSSPCLVLGSDGRFPDLADPSGRLNIPESVLAMQRETRTDALSQDVLQALPLLAAILMEDFCRNFHRNFVPLKQMIDFSSDPTTCAAAVWDSPPILPIGKALLVELLLTSGVPVLGFQHGGNYGIQKTFPRHFDSDFSCCTHYFSYGFTRSDLAETEPLVEPLCQIIPSGAFERGTKNLFGSRAPKPQYDILFPLTNACSFHRDSLRIPGIDLASQQWDLLRFLDGLRNCKVLVKPFAKFNHDNSSFSESLATLKNLDVHAKFPLDVYFEVFKINVILVEYASGPLYESISKDVEIILLMDTATSFNPSAWNLIQKRTHACSTVGEVKQKIKDYMAGNLESRRDVSFAKRFLSLGNENGNRSSVINSAVLDLVEDRSLSRAPSTFRRPV